MKNILGYCLLGFLITGCINKSKENVGKGVYVIEQECCEITIGDKEQVDASRIVEDMDIIPLGAIPRGGLGSVDMLLALDEHWVVVDKFKAKGVFLFDKEGSFVRQIGQLGRGPGEFINISDVAIIPKSNEIAILDQQMGKVNTYDMNGKFLSSTQTKYGITMLQFFNEKSAVGFRIGRFSYGSGKENSLDKQAILYFNDKLELQNYTFNDTYPSSLRTVNDKMHKMGDIIYFAPNFGNAIYTVKENEVRKIYDIKFNKNEIAEDIIRSQAPNISEYTSSYNYFSGNFIELKNYLFIVTSESGIARSDLYDKKGNKLYYLSPVTNSPLDDYLPQSRYYVSENQIAAIGDPGIMLLFQDKIKQWIKTQDPKIIGKKKYNQLKYLAEDITDDSNPVIFVYSLKDEII